ncbi:SIMPL domain-containing protein [Alteromonas aestuariivivens]|nr:SIMPL domain-containing protein [Alteromonas aestuariivivens]
MNSRVKFLLLLTTAAILTLPASYAQSASAPAIHVQGQGVVNVVPDAFSVTFVLEQRGASVTKLNSQLEFDLNQVVSYLLSVGVSEKHIQSMQVQLNPWIEHGPNGREDKGFVLARQVRVMHGDLQSYDKLLDGVMARGVTRIQQFEFVASTEKNAYQQALINAVGDARSRAQLLARELGVKIGQVISVSESGFSQPTPVHRAVMMDRERTSSMPGQQQIEARVQVSFAIAE